MRPAQQGARQQPITLTRRINLHPGQSHAIALECIANGASGTLNDRGGLTTRQFVQQIDDRIFFGEALQRRFDEFDTLICLQQDQQQTRIHIAAFLNDRLNIKHAVCCIRLIDPDIATDARSARRWTAHAKLLGCRARQHPNLDSAHKQEALIDKAINEAIEVGAHRWQHRHYLLPLNRRQIAQQTARRTDRRRNATAGDQRQHITGLLAEVIEECAALIQSNCTQHRARRMEMGCRPFQLGDCNPEQRGARAHVSPLYLLDRLTERQGMGKGALTADPRNQVQRIGQWQSW